jgi:hypothetical protein
MDDFLLGLITFLLLIIAIMIVVVGIAVLILVLSAIKFFRSTKVKVDNFVKDTNHKVEVFTARAKGYQDAVKSPAGIFVALWSLIKKVKKTKK